MDLVEDGAPTCPYCGGDAVLRLGAEVVPRSPHRAGQPLWSCGPCGAYVGCHAGTTRALGVPGDRRLRRARRALHAEVLDPLWREAWRSPTYAGRTLTPAILDRIARTARRRVYDWLAEHLDLAEAEAHVAMFDLETCEAARRALTGVTYEDVREWARPFEEARRVVRDHARRTGGWAADDARPLAA